MNEPSLNDEEKLHKQMAKARKANELLSNEAFTGIVDQIKQDTFKRWQSTTDAAERDRCWMVVNLVDRLVDGLGKAMTDGKFASASLEKILTDKARKAA